MWREFNLINSFTLEATFCGPSDGRYQDCHFTIAILKDLGRVFCRTLLDYASNEPKVREAIRELETMFPPSKAEEGLSQHFLQQDELRQDAGKQKYADDEPSGQDDKANGKTKQKKKVLGGKSGKDKDGAQIQMTRTGERGEKSR